ncbi:MAG TPA: transglutaminase-like domain-containing protein [Thermoanaerobaculia bacterium]|nr:transglutaminase-like domain-containing protein [Thermoanaerobaculia bacterium]
MKTGTCLALAAALAAAPALGGDELAVYRATGAGPGLFDQYDNDGYSLAVARAADGTLLLSIRVSGAPLGSRAPFPTGLPREAALTAAPDRDAWAIALAGSAKTEAEAVERILEGVAAHVRYDGDRARRQDPASVYASGRAHCVGFAELAVDLLRRVGITARTVQGVLRTSASAEGYDSHIGGVYHRWIEIYYPDRGFVFSDPSASINGVDARYIPFGTRALERPQGLTLTSVETSGKLDYPLRRLPDATLRIRPAEAQQ